MKDFFLCHASEDKANYVRPLADEMQRLGLSYWLDEAEVDWGDNLQQKINDGLRECRFVIAFLSEAFIGKQWPKKELYAALDMEDAEAGKKVLPLMLASPETILHEYPLLRQKVYVTFAEGASTIAARCHAISQGKMRVVGNEAFDVEDQEEMTRAGYEKKEIVEYSFSETVKDHRLRFKTKSSEGTPVLLTIANRELERMATELGARSSVIHAIGEKAPELADKLEGDEDIMKALTDFAKVFAKPSLVKHRRRQRTTVGTDGYVEVTGLTDILDGWVADVKVTPIG